MDGTVLSKQYRTTGAGTNNACMTSCDGASELCGHIMVTSSSYVKTVGYRSPAAAAAPVEEKSEFKINRDEFTKWFDLMGVQRHLKASGIFARLSNRDGKHKFLDDIPRTLSYIVELKEKYQDLQPVGNLIEKLILNLQKVYSHHVLKLLKV